MLLLQYKWMILVWVPVSAGSTAEESYLLMQIWCRNRGQALSGPSHNIWDHILVARPPSGTRAEASHLIGWGGCWVFWERCSKCIPEAERMGKPGTIWKRMTWVYDFKRWYRVMNLMWAPAHPWMTEDVNIKSNSPHSQLLNFTAAMAICRAEYWYLFDLHIDRYVWLRSVVNLQPSATKNAWILHS